MLFGLIKTRKDHRLREARERRATEIETVSREIREIANDISEIANDISVRLSVPANCPATGKRCPFMGPPPAYGTNEPMP